VLDCTTSLPSSAALGERAMRIKHPVPPKALALSRRPPAELSDVAKKRLKWMDYYQAHAGNASLTCRHFDISRSTFYLWRRRYDPHHLASLEDRSSRPRRVKRPTWTLEQVKAVQRLREQYPRWGKNKLKVLLGRQGITLSASMVGRILGHLKHTGQLVEPVPRRTGVRKKNRVHRVHAVRKPKEYGAQKAGDIVQIDTQDVYPLPGMHLKHFTATDVVCKWSVCSLHSRATALTAKAALDEVLERMPFWVVAIQIDGGSEYMAEFEQACKDKGIKLFLLPPRSPKLNGTVERSHRTHQEEFYEVTQAEGTPEAIRKELREWEDTYNTLRPHQTLGYKTPLEYLQEHGQYQPKNRSGKEGCTGGTGPIHLLLRRRGKCWTIVWLV
jgi:putative transposase